MLPLPDRQILSFPCDRAVSGHHRRRAVRRRDHRDARRGIQRERPAQQTQQVAAAGTEFQSRLDEDAEHQARSGADAGDQAGRAQLTEVQAAAVPKPVAAAQQVSVEQAEARLEQKVPRPRVQQVSALLFLAVLPQRELIQLPAQAPFRPAAVQPNAGAM